MNIAFQYHPDILERFPKVVGGIILARGIQNGATPDALATDYLAEQQAVIARIGATPLSDLPSIAAWRAGFRAFGVEPTQYRCAAEALLRRLTKKGDIPSINTLVDIGNLVSIRYALPVGICDTRALSGAITVHFAGGTERFVPLGETTTENPEPGEVIFSDPAGLCAARRWCWQQSDEVAARDTTTDAIISIEALHDDSRGMVEEAMADMEGLMQRYMGGAYMSGVLSVERAGIGWD